MAFYVAKNYGTSEAGGTLMIIEYSTLRDVDPATAGNWTRLENPTYYVPVPGANPGVSWVLLPHPIEQIYHIRVRRQHSSGEIAYGDLRFRCSPAFVDQTNTGIVECTEHDCSVAGQFEQDYSFGLLDGRIEGSTISVSFSGREASIDVKENGVITADYRGYRPNEGLGVSWFDYDRTHNPAGLVPAGTLDGPDAVCTNTSARNGLGGSHGGGGGKSCYVSESCAPASVSGTPYGLATNPWDFGSGGRHSFVFGSKAAEGGAGGGRVKLESSKYITITKPEGTPAVSADGGAGLYW